MADFFPPGFWKLTVLLTTGFLSVIAVDLLFGSRLMLWVGCTMNKKVHIDDVVVKTLAALKKKSDQEFETEASLVQGTGRFITSGILLVCVYLMVAFLLPRLT